MSLTLLIFYFNSVEQTKDNRNDNVTLSSFFAFIVQTILYNIDTAHMVIK